MLPPRDDDLTIYDDWWAASPEGALTLRYLLRVAAGELKPGLQPTSGLDRYVRAKRWIGDRGELTPEGRVQLSGFTKDPHQKSRRLATRGILLLTNPRFEADPSLPVCVGAGRSQGRSDGRR